MTRVGRNELQENPTVSDLDMHLLLVCIQIASLTMLMNCKKCDLKPKYDNKQGKGGGDVDTEGVRE